MSLLEFTSQITPASIDRLMADLRRPGAPRRLFVSSPGGQFEFFSRVAPAIESRGLITVGGDVRSAANILYMLGRHRQAYPDSEFFFHEVRAMVGAYGQVKLGTMEELMDMNAYMEGEERELYEEWVRLTRSAQSWYIRFMQEKTGVPTSTFLNLMRSEATLSAREAMQYGIVHEIVAHDR